MAESERVYIAIAPPDALDESIINNVADSIGKSPYNTRLLLAGEIPKIIVHCEGIQAAELKVEELRASGLTAIAFTDSELRRSPQRFTAQTMEFGDGEVLFGDSSGHEKKLGEDEVFLVLEGMMHISTEEETTTTKTRLNLPATLLAGGIPIQRKIKEKTTTTSVRTEYFTRLYGRASADAFIEVRQHHVNYSFLGAEIAASSGANFATVIKKFRVLFPGAIFDNRLIKPINVRASSGREWGTIDTICKLIYSFYRIANSPGS